MFNGLLASIINASNHTKRIFLKNQQCKIQPTLFNLNPYEYGQRLCYYPFAINLDRCMGNCNTLKDLSNRLYVSDKTEDLKLNVFNMITRINESKALTNYISCKCRYTFGCSKYNSNQKWINDKCWSKCKKYQMCNENYNWNATTCICENGKYLGSIIDNSVITYDKIMSGTYSVSTNVACTVSTSFYNKKVKNKMNC